LSKGLSRYLDWVVGFPADKAREPALLAQFRLGVINDTGNRITGTGQKMS